MPLCNHELEKGVSQTQSYRGGRGGWGGVNPTSEFALHNVYFAFLGNINYLHTFRNFNVVKTVTDISIFPLNQGASLKH